MEAQLLIAYKVKQFQAVDESTLINTRDSYEKSSRDLCCEEQPII